MRWRLPFLALVVPYFSHSVRARYAESVNGQQHTLGLSIISAPAANSQFNAPGNLPIAIDVSGNGKISRDASARLSSLELYLVSASLNLNVTVSGSNARLIDTEPGSTVKHVNYQLPDCLPAGPYNLTLYDKGFYEDQSYFTITSVPLTLRSRSTSTSLACVSPAATRPAGQPQADSPLRSAPFGPSGGGGGGGDNNSEGANAGGTTSSKVISPTTSEPAVSPTSTNGNTETQVVTTSSEPTLPAPATRPGSTSGFGAPKPPGDDQADEPGSGGTTVMPSTDTTQDPEDGVIDIPNMPAPVPEQVITIHGGFIVPVLADSAHSLGSNCFLIVVSASVLIAKLL